MVTNPTWNPVQSSNIDALAYEPTSKRLMVRFRGGRVYVHHDVEAHHYEALVGDGIEGHSVGKHYAAHIKGKFPGHREEGPPDEVA